MMALFAAVIMSVSCKLIVGEYAEDCDGKAEATCEEQRKDCSLVCDESEDEASVSDRPGDG